MVPTISMAIMRKSNAPLKIRHNPGDGMMAKLVPLDDEKPYGFEFGSHKSVLTDEVVEAIEAPLPDDLLDAMLNGPIDPGEAK
jgi:hypothetical protein